MDHNQKAQVKRNRRPMRSRIARRIISKALDAGCVAAGVALVVGLHVVLFIDEALADDD